MVGQVFWDALADQLARIYTWMTSTQAVSFTYEGTTYSLSFFAVFISLLVVLILVNLAFWFVDNGDDSDD